MANSATHSGINKLDVTDRPLPVTHIGIRKLPVVSDLTIHDACQDFCLDSHGEIAVLYHGYLIYRDRAVNILELELKLVSIFFDDHDILYGCVSNRYKHERQLVRFDKSSLLPSTAGVEVNLRGHGGCIVWIQGHSRSHYYGFAENLAYVKLLCFDTLQMIEVPLPELDSLRLSCVKVVAQQQGFWLFCLPDISRMTEEGKGVAITNEERLRNFIVHLNTELQVIKIVTLVEFVDRRCLQELVVLDDRLFYERTAISGRKVYDVHGYYHGRMLLPFQPYSKILRYHEDWFYIYSVPYDCNDNRCGQDDQDDTFYISAPRELDIYSYSIFRYEIPAIFCLMMMVSDQELDSRYQELSKLRFEIASNSHYKYGHREMLRVTDLNLSINKVKRFFYITGGLPVELKMLIANRCYGSLREGIKQRDWTAALRQLDSESS